MTSKSLREKCISSFGNINGNRIYEVMTIIANRDYCVATGWDDHQVSIAKSCLFRGRVFKITDDYGGLILPENKIVKISEISYSDINGYLPKSPFRGLEKHCGLDDILLRKL